MKQFVLFLHGRYRQADLPFYKKLCRSKIKVAVNGGLSFFRKAGIVPDMLVGDLDSADRHLQNLSPKTEVLTFPRRKNKTDSQLAVEHFIARKARRIDMVVPALGQPDHFAANLLLPTLAGVSAWAKRGGRFRIISRAYEVAYVVDGEVSFSGCIGHIVSLTPLSRQIVLSCEGTEYDVSGARIPRGHTRALRNRIDARRAVFRIKGEVLVWHLFR
ncbi:MAG: thiamine diphosphokinase [Candidatus Zixiibacteriota bacterium]|nr:MAG: thiamine diphosphokinase [candidate division Zixibacteria bacterium]